MIGESLVEKGIITRKQLEEALQDQKSSGEFLGSILVGKKYASEHLIAKALSEELGLAFMDLSKYSIEASAIKLVPEAVCRKYTLVPVYEAGGNLTVAMADPTDEAVKDELKGLTKLKIRPVFSPLSEIKGRIEKEYAGPSKAPYSAPAAAPSPGKEVEELIEVASLAPVIQVVDTLITKAVELGASDIHLEPDQGHFYCRYRIDGMLREIPELPKKYEAAIISRIKIMSNMDIAEKRLPQDGRIQATVANKSVDLRVSTFPTLSGENVVLRILDRSRAFLELDGLGFAPDNLKIIEKAIKRPFGMILVTGPTGSGKTTTLYAALNKVNNLDKNIMTLEDPVEYEIPRIRQSQVNVKAGLTFAAGLRSMVRQDPDVIMIGEIRDKETADIAIHAALTGHLVFSTLHTNDSASAATRLIDIGVEPFLVGTSVIAIIAQRLVRTLCPHCKKPYTPGREELDILGLGPIDEKAVFDTGYSGRTGIFEILALDDKMKELISRKVSSTQIHEAAVRDGMKTLRDDGTLKVKAGITTVAEVLRVTKEA